jgi:uncharacterized protein YbjT (DUF2867 family)
MLRTVQALVAGGSGLVGRSLLEFLLADARVERVVSIVRRASLPSHPKLEERVVDFETLEVALRGVSATHAFCCLGTTIAQAGSKEAFRRVDFEYPLSFARAARENGAQSYLLVSAAGANPNSLVFYNRVKGEVERALAELGFASLHLLRPSLLLGEREKPRTGELLGAAMARPLRGMFKGRLAKYAPIAARDVAKALVALGLGSQDGSFVHESDEIARLASAYR